MSGIVEGSVGSEKQFKVELAREFLQHEFSSELISLAVARADSGVSETPTSVDECRQGACTRSLLSLSTNKFGHIGIGLEGGVFPDRENLLYVIEAAAISIKMNETEFYTESGVSEGVKLPNKIIEAVKTGFH